LEIGAASYEKSLAVLKHYLYLAVTSSRQEKCAGIGKVGTYPASQSKILLEASAADMSCFEINPLSA
jgi:hypothetical protein